MLTIYPRRSAGDLLSLAHDGPIPPHLLDVARRIDAAAKLKNRPARLRLGNIVMKRHVAVGLMTEVILARAPEGVVTEADFAAVGVSKAHISALGREAWARAAAIDPRVAQLLARAA